jgi:hypothetical protein
MSVMLSKHESGRDLEPMAGHAGRLRNLGAEGRLYAPDYAEQPARVGVPRLPSGVLR